MLDYNIMTLHLQDLHSNTQLEFDPIESSDVTQKIGRYILDRELGRGSMGKVHLVHDPFIGRRAAIKTALTTPNSIHSIDEIQQRFFNEARASGKLMHPNIVALYDAFIEKNNFYLVMEYVEGTTLKEYCRKKSRLSLEEAVSIIFQCAKALDYAHINGIIHRDIKPNNILISSGGEAKITDFSIAVVEGLSIPFKSGSFTGSVFYTPPELLREEQVSAQSDIFSLGVVMYEIIAGIKPFVGDTEVAVFYNILNKEPEPLKSHQKDIPDSLELIVSRALEKDPMNRYRSGSELASDLIKFNDNIRFLEDDIDFQEKFRALKKLSFFESFSDNELGEVLKATKWLQHSADTDIITEGEIDDCFYIIVKGEVSVSKGGKSLAYLRQGDCFGEMAYLGKTKRTADIKALKETVLMKVNASIMEGTSQNTQNRFYKVFSKTLIERLSRANRVIAKYIEKGY